MDPVINQNSDSSRICYSMDPSNDENGGPKDEGGRLSWQYPNGATKHQNVKGAAKAAKSSGKGVRNKDIIVDQACPWALL
jgi:hypothetical protein